MTSQDIEKKLTKFVSKYGNLYKGKFEIDETLNDAFNNIANNNKALFCYDIEFHNQVVNNKKYIIPNENKKITIAPFIRELGIIIFIKDESKWKYLGYIFKNIKNTCDDNTIFILSKYATVMNYTNKIMSKGDNYFNVYEALTNLTFDNLNKKTFNYINYKLSVEYIKKIFDYEDYKNIKLGLKILKKVTLNKEVENENNLEELKKDFKCAIRKLHIVRDMPFRIYPKILDDEGKKIYNMQQESYYNDKLVKTRTLTNKELYEFLISWLSFDQDVCYVVKGKNDFIAVKNTMLNVLNHCNIKFNKVYDIEIFNWLSYIKFGSAQLENTYLGIKENFKKYNDKLDIIFNHFAFKNAHNPVVDSFYTIIVALYINLILNANLIK